MVGVLVALELVVVVLGLYGGYFLIFFLSPPSSLLSSSLPFLSLLALVRRFNPDTSLAWILFYTRLLSLLLLAAVRAVVVVRGRVDELLCVGFVCLP